jgi:hypothetical protein
MKFSHLILLFAVLLFGAASHAGSALFEVLDRDSNGYLTLEETQHTPQLHLQFSQADLNKNDRLEVGEMELLDIPLSFADLDTDVSLGITPEEAAALRTLHNQFSRLDQNKDQIIDPGEFAEFAPPAG